jgi:hypothetical protein
MPDLMSLALRMPMRASTYLKNHLWNVSSIAGLVQLARGAIMYPHPVLQRRLRTPFGIMDFPDMSAYVVFHSAWEPDTRRIVGALRGSLFVDVGAWGGLYAEKQVAFSLREC